MNVNVALQDAILTPLASTQKVLTVVNATMVLWEMEDTVPVS